MSADQFQFATFPRDDSVNGTWQAQWDTDGSFADDQAVATQETDLAFYDTNADGYVSPTDALLFAGEDFLF